MLHIGKLLVLNPRPKAEIRPAGAECMHKTDGCVATTVWTGGLALLLTVVAGGIWTALLLANLGTTPAVPWAVAAMALVLWSIWSYLGGKWPPERTREVRRRYLRARRLSRVIFIWALLAGVLSVVSLAGLWIVMFRLVRIRGNPVADFSRFPLITVVAVLAMASLVSSVAEEAGFRGYFQVALESRFSGRVAVLIAAILIAPAHAFTQGFLWPTVLFYLLVDTMLGTSAYLTKSIFPGIVVHTIGLLIFFGLVWPQDRHRELIWESGTDTWFWIHVAQAFVFAALGIMAFVRLAGLVAPKPRAAARL
jgi:membrane protease YdiL (CAAX protease family)